MIDLPPHFFVDVPYLEIVNSQNFPLYKRLEGFDSFDSFASTLLG